MLSVTVLNIEIEPVLTSAPGGGYQTKLSLLLSGETPLTSAELHHFYQGMCPVQVFACGVQ